VCADSNTKKTIDVYVLIKDFVCYEKPLVIIRTIAQPWKSIQLKTGYGREMIRTEDARFFTR